MSIFDIAHERNSMALLKAREKQGPTSFKVGSPLKLEVAKGKRERERAGGRKNAI